MPSGSQARWLAPVALIVAFLAVAFVVTTSTGGEADDPPAASQEPGRTTRTSTGTSTAPRTQTGERAQEGGGTGTTGTTSTTAKTEKKSYTVQTGDTFGSISEQTGVSVAELQELNPTVDPQALTVGQDLRLSR